MTLNLKRSFDDPDREKKERFSDSLFDMSYTELAVLNCEAYVSEEPLSFKERFCGRRMTLSPGNKWAKNVFDCAWFHVTGKIPPSADTILVVCGGEGLIYGKNGEEIQAVTCSAADYGGDLGNSVKRAVPITDEMTENGSFDFWIDGAANDLFGDLRTDGKITELSAARLNKNIRDLAYDIQVLLSVYDYGDDKEFGEKIYAAVDEISKTEITEENAGEMRKILAPLLSEKSNEDFTYYAVGHAHTDLAWLWPIRETKRKGGRTFATQIKNIERYPGYVFGASQAQLYTWIKDGYPAVYKKVKELVKEGSWDVQGATWVEPDSNLIGGESLIRQFFYGKKFFKEEFGLDMQIFWVPDSFGYSACIPQVMKLADVPYFLTQKISWNTFNKFPYHSFYWQGLDGTAVLAHMLPEDTYNSPMRGDFLKAGEKRYSERSISNKALSLYGIGDGGGGPGYEHIERAKRYENLRSMPKVKMCRSMDFFRDFDDGKTNYPTYKGELYLEKHQGTYTTRSANKRFNRKCEFALRNYEAAAALTGNSDCELPIKKDELDKVWQEILLYQFHDILPGSSINRVYEECLPRYEMIYNKLTNSYRDMLNRIFPKLTVANPNPFEYKTKIEIDNRWYAVTLPPMGAVSVSDSSKIEKFYASCAYNTIENDKMKITFESGFISSIYDKEMSAEFIPKGKKAAVVSQYDDFGDCWDMQGAKADYIQTKKDSACTYFRTKCCGAKAFAECRYTVGECEIKQYFYIIDGDNCLYCDMELNVSQSNKMLRMAIPVNIDTDECAFNIQFGHIFRKTTEYTSEELAQFEVSGQKFADMSEDEKGISFINDCKYGYRCKNGVIDLNLVRSPKGGPGKSVDQGLHKIHWTLMPHRGRLSKETYAKAYLVNNPLIVTNGEAGDEKSYEPYRTDNENVILETVKIPENGNGIIARFYNCSAEKQTANVSIEGFKPTEIVNILEDKLNDVTDNKLALSPFELINIRFVK
ncbi:MAG: glycosyl hydrolase-related protein [Clostridiales bacterium]|nr:glycosyl hydrolase-related protein [Clostridiales bacterium]